MIQHESFVNLYNKDKEVFKTIFKDTKNITQLTNKIIKISKEFVKFSYKDENKLKGDLFEIFAECFFKILSADNRIGVYNYQPAPAHNDNGVDGFGLGMDNNPCTIQVKFRGNTSEELTQEDIKQFGFQSIINYNVDKDTKNNMIVFTNVKGLHYHTDTKVFSGRIRTIGNKEIGKLVNNNSVFWLNLNDLVKKTIGERYIVKVC